MASRRPTAHPPEPLSALMARAAAGELEAIRRLASTQEGVKAVVHNRLAPLLAILANQNGLQAPEEWTAIMRQTAIMRMLLEIALHELGPVLDAATIPWLPLKGMGLVAGLYPAPECRPTSDLDILVPEERFLEARELIRAQGWEDIHPGPLYEDFLVKEGYNWQARHTSGVMLELHFRLWGPVDPALPAAILDGARPLPDLGRMARSPGPIGGYIVAACHLWNSHLPAALMYYLDLHLLAQAGTGDPAFVESVVAIASRHGLQLLVGLAATAAGQLWENAPNTTIAEELLDDLHPTERAAAALAQRSQPPKISLGTLVLARLLSGRKSRTGWRAPYRRLWPHPAIFHDLHPKGPLAALRRALTERR